MYKLVRILSYWIPPLVWMTAIFYMSSQKSVATLSDPTTNFITFKTLHIIEYAFLFFLLFRAMQSFKKLEMTITTLCAFFITLFYSLTDEFHQLFIPTRQGRLRDVFFDIVGILVMYTIIKNVRLVQKLL